MSSKGSGSFVADQTDVGSSTWNNPEEVQKQLERVVESVHFRNSKRYPALLRYLVEKTLQGTTDELKERTLGIEVFGRPPDYDTNADPVVRISAGEVRKRIAQYYQCEKHEHELRLELPLGSYAPRFLPPHGAPSAARYHTQLPVNHGFQTLPKLPASARVLDATEPLSSAELFSLETVVSAEPPQKPASKAKHLRLYSRLFQVIFAVVIVGICAIIFVGVAKSRRQEDGLKAFWGPILRSKDPATIVLGVHSFDTKGNDFSPISLAHLPQGEQTALASMIHLNMVPVSDVVSYSGIVSLLTRQSVPFNTQSAAETTIEEFRRGPIVLIGGFDNMWTMRLTSSLRFRFAADSDSMHEIRDSQHPDSRWQFDNAQNALTNSRDYAIVARFFDPQIEQQVVVVAGIGKSGTEAAAEFVTDKLNLQNWVESISSESRTNIEIVLSTDLIEGRHGPPHVVASYRW